MTQSPLHPPRRILLATDLGPRSDRALDRAVQLAGQWEAELVVVYVAEQAEQGAAAGLAAKARKRLSHDLAGLHDNVRVMVEHGEDPAACLLHIARRERCGLIVTGMARDETLGRIWMGTTAHHLVRRGDVPVLVVRRRVRSAYHSIVIGTDFSSASCEALLTAGAFFPEAELTLFHGYDQPYTRELDKRAISEEMQRVVRRMQDEYMADARIDDALRRRIRIAVDYGSPQRLLAGFAEVKDADLTVIGSHGRGALFDALVGSTADHLLRDHDDDLLIIRYREQK